MPKQQPPNPGTPAERRAEAVRLRVEGKSPGEVAKALKVSAAVARRLIREGILELAGIDPEEARHFDLARTERLIDKYMTLAIRGDAESARLVLAAMAHKAKLLGLDSPPTNPNLGKVEVTIVKAPRPEAKPPTADEA